MHHSAAIPFSGDPSLAFDLAISLLTGIGFRIEKRDSGVVQFTGPGMNSTRESPLRGASQLRIREGIQELSVEAELGGVERMCRFIRIFPLALNFFLLLLAVVITAASHPAVLPIVAGVAAAATGVNALVWLALSPMICRQLERKICRFIDTLLENLAAAQNAG